MLRKVVGSFPGRSRGMETVKQCREDGYRGKLKKENEDDDVAGERDICRRLDKWRPPRRKDNTRNGGRRRTGWFLGLDILEVPYFRRSPA